MGDYPGFVDVVQDGFYFLLFVTAALYYEKSMRTRKDV